MMGIIIALTNFSQQHITSTELNLKVVVHPLWSVNRFIKSQTDVSAGRNSIGTAIGVNGNIEFVIDGLIRVRIIDTNQHITTALVNDILGFVPMEVIGRILAFF